MRKDIGDAEGRQGMAMSHTFIVPQSTGVCHDVCVKAQPCCPASVQSMGTN